MFLLDKLIITLFVFFWASFFNVHFPIPDGLEMKVVDYYFLLFRNRLNKFVSHRFQAKEERMCLCHYFHVRGNFAFVRLLANDEVEKKKRREEGTSEGSEDALMIRGVSE